MNIDIRSAETADAARLSEIALTAKKHWRYPQAWFELWGDQLVVSPEYITSHVLRLACRHNVIVGFGAIGVTGTEADLEHMWVLPDYMGQGIGKMLLTSLLEYCCAIGIKHLRIESDPNAREFYEKMGARHIGFVASKPMPRKLPLLLIETGGTPTTT